MTMGMGQTPMDRSGFCAGTYLDRWQAHPRQAKAQCNALLLVLSEELTALHSVVRNGTRSQLTAMLDRKP
jgi:hypothetical protein